MRLSRLAQDPKFITIGGILATSFALNTTSWPTVYAALLGMGLGGSAGFLFHQGGPQLEDLLSLFRTKPRNRNGASVTRTPASPQINKSGTWSPRRRKRPNPMMYYAVVAIALVLLFYFVPDLWIAVCDVWAIIYNSFSAVLFTSIILLVCFGTTFVLVLSQLGCTYEQFRAILRGTPPSKVKKPGSPKPSVRTATATTTNTATTFKRNTPATRSFSADGRLQRPNQGPSKATGPAWGGTSGPSRQPGISTGFIDENGRLRRTQPDWDPSPPRKFGRTPSQRQTMPSKRAQSPGPRTSTTAHRGGPSSMPTRYSPSQEASPRLLPQGSPRPLPGDKRYGSPQRRPGYPPPMPQPIPQQRTPSPPPRSRQYGHDTGTPPWGIAQGRNSPWSDDSFEEEARRRPAGRQDLSSLPPKWPPYRRNDMGGHGLEDSYQRDRQTPPWGISQGRNSPRSDDSFEEEARRRPAGRQEPSSLPSKWSPFRNQRHGPGSEDSSLRNRQPPRYRPPTPPDQPIPGEEDEEAARHHFLSGHPDEPFGKKDYRPQPSHVPSKAPAKSMHVSNSKPEPNSGDHWRPNDAYPPKNTTSHSQSSADSVEMIEED